MSGLEALLTGRTLVKRYRIGEVIGRGGFAAVYRAEDDRLGRPVAVKVMTYPAPDARTREQLRERFQREARAAASLPQHPNVVTVHDFGTDPALGLDFLVMEFLHGENLAAHLDRHGRPPLGAALGILRETAEGLCLGHRAGLVHRDVKPGNVFLARTGPDDPVRVCLLDFGIAHLVEEERASTRLTQTGFAPHSPAYASPEQLAGEAHLTPASDVFSLGVVGYQLLTGEKPFGDGARTRPAEWVPARGVREACPEVPAAVEEVIRRAMSYEPGERFRDACEMGSALDRAMGVETTVYVPADAVPAAAAGEDHTLLQAPPPPPPPSARRPSRRVGERRRRRFPAWLAALPVVLLLVAALWALGRGAGGGRSEGAGAARAPEVAPGEGAAAGAGGEGAVADTVALPAPEAGVEVGAASPPTTRVNPPAPSTPATRTPAAAGPAAGSGTPARTPAAPESIPANPTPAPFPAHPAPTEPARPAPEPEPEDTLSPRPPPRLLGRPAHPDSARPDTAAIPGMP